MISGSRGTTPAVQTASLLLTASDPLVGRKSNKSVPKDNTQANLLLCPFAEESPAVCTRFAWETTFFAVSFWSVLLRPNLDVRGVGYFVS